MARTTDERGASDEPDEESSGSGDPGGARKPFLLRLPAALMAELRGWAAQDVRSLNGQIEFVLKEAVRKRKGGA